MLITPVRTFPSTWVFNRPSPILFFSYFSFILYYYTRISFLSLYSYLVLEEAVDALEPRAVLVLVVQVQGEENSVRKLVVHAELLQVVVERLLA